MIDDVFTNVMIKTPIVTTFSDIKVERLKQILV